MRHFAIRVSIRSISFSVMAGLYAIGSVYISGNYLLQQDLTNTIIATSVPNVSRERNSATTNHETLALSPQTTKNDQDLSYLECAFNQPYPRPRHACIANKDLGISYCHMESVMILIDNVKVSTGNESVADVLGRTDEEELPQYTEPGTFLIDKPLIVQEGFARGVEQIFYLEDVLQATQVQTQKPQCTLKISGPVLLITRYEYCNLYHTMTDWFNTFYALPDPKARVTVIFLDGHAKGALDPVWPQVFGDTHFIKSFPQGTRLCLEDATFVPAGYVSPLWTRNRVFPFPRCREMMDAFVRRFLESYGVYETKMVPGRVTIVGRKPYLAHPRSKPDSIARTVSNMPDLASKIKGSRMVYFETMTIQEQLQAIRETEVLIANHGAALTHLLFLHDGATAMEFVDPATPMFDDMAAWRPTIRREYLPQLGDAIIRKKVMVRTVERVEKVLNTTL